jgi:hypothetical protein
MREIVGAPIGLSHRTPTTVAPAGKPNGYTWIHLPCARSSEVALWVVLRPSEKTYTRNGNNQMLIENRDELRVFLQVVDPARLRSRSPSATPCHAARPADVWVQVRGLGNRKH